jgi:hypothetical protein
MTITLTKPKTQIIWRSNTPGTKITSIPGSDMTNNGYTLDIKTALGNGDSHIVYPTSGTIDLLPSVTFFDTQCNLFLRSDGVHNNWIVRCLCCYTTVLPLIYSQRLVIPTYAGPIYKLRRDSDNAAMDFFPAPVGVDQAAITAWLGGANGFVDTWYDQGPFAFHARNAVFAQQPQWLANAQGGRPGIKFGLTPYISPPNPAAIQQLLVSTPPFITAATLFQGTTTIFMALALQTSTSWPTVGGGDYVTAPVAFFKSSSSNQIANSFVVGGAPTGTTSGYVSGATHAETAFTEAYDTSFHLWDNAVGIGLEDFIVDGATLPVNSGPVEAGPLLPIQGSNLFIKIGNNFDTPLYGTFQELRIYNRAPLAGQDFNTPNRASIRADIKAYYSLP